MEAVRHPWQLSTASVSSIEVPVPVLIPPTTDILCQESRVKIWMPFSFLKTIRNPKMDSYETPQRFVTWYLSTMTSQDYRPPGAFLQKVNSLAQQEPFDFILYSLYWSVIISLFSPVAILLLKLRLLFRLFTWILGIVRKHAACEPNKHPTRELAVVITGCDTGFGREAALRAADAGYIVFAGCLRVESVAELKKSPGRINAFTMDVTDDKDVEKVVQIVSNWLEEANATTGKERILHSLVNMAGVGFCGNVDFMPLSLFQKSMDGE